MLGFVHAINPQLVAPPPPVLEGSLQLIKFELLTPDLSLESKNVVDCSRIVGMETVKGFLQKLPVSVVFPRTVLLQF
jgi:hypothetical protein